MVVRNAYSGSYSSLTSKTLTIVGLTSETSTTNVTIIKELSIEFLNSVYETIVDAGYSDAVKNAEEYSITVLGFKFYVVVGTNYTPNIYAEPISYVLPASTISIAKSINNAQYDYMYNITVRGDSNMIVISYEGYDYYGVYEYTLFFIAKAKNLITGENGYFFGRKLYATSGSTTAYQNFLISKEHNYTYIHSTGSGTGNGLLVPSYINSGINTKNRYVCEPQLAYDGTYLIYSMIRGNKAIFSKGNYYKIGNDIYHCYNGNNDSSDGVFLYKVE